VRGAKFGKDRLVPLHPSTCRVLADYLVRRERHWAGRTVSAYLVVSSWGNRLDNAPIHRAFYAASRRIGLRSPEDHHGPRLHDLRGAAAMTTITLAPLLERFFTQRLINERQVSPHTIGSYRDTFRLLLKFTHQRLHTQPSALAFEQIDAPLVVAFLDDLEKQRGASVRSRNLRLTAIHSLFRYAAFELPTHSAQIQRVLAMPMMRWFIAAVRSRPRRSCRPLLHG